MSTNSVTLQKIGCIEYSSTLRASYRSVTCGVKFVCAARLNPLRVSAVPSICRNAFKQRRPSSPISKHALQRCVTAASLIGGRALIINAVDIEAAGFWKRRGFIPSKDDPLILLRSIADIAASLANERGCRNA
jgi:hypothetical protein